MQNYWNSRFGGEGEIWGSEPSKTAFHALDLFKRNKVSKVLVPGAGYGRNAALFAREGFEVTGIEISEEALKLALNKEQIKYSHGSVLAMPFSDDIYDAIYCFNVLHLFRARERKEFLAKCYEQLGDNGLAFFTVFSEKEPSYGKGAEVEKNTFESKPGRPVHYYTAEDLAEQFGAFDIIESGIMEDPENHGEEGPHTHLVRYIYARKKAPFEFDGEKYQKASRHQKEWGNKIIAGLKMAGNEKILDLGCGDGVLTAELARLVPEGLVLGIDASENMIATALKLANKNLQFRRMDINEIDFVNEFDLIFSNAALHWIKDHKLLLQKVYQALKTGGKARFNFAGDGNCATFYRVVKETMRQPEFTALFKNFKWPWYMPEKNDYEKLLENSLFKDVEVWTENADRYFRDAEEMIGWIDQPSLVPFLRHLERQEARDSFRELVVDRMLELARQEDGSCFEYFRRINVIAFK